MSVVYYDGSIGKLNDITIPLSDRSIYFGDSVYDIAIGKKGKIYQAEEHIERLLRGAGFLGFPAQYSFEEIFDILQEVATLADCESYSVYFQLSRSTEKRVHSALGCKKVHFLIVIDEYTLPDQSTAKLTVIEDKRYSYCHIKTTNLLPAVLYSTDAEKRGFDEVVLHRGNTVTECAHSNIFMLRKGVLYTHPCTENILPGITRQNLIFAAQKLSVPCVQRPFTLSELYRCDEAIITSTTRFARIVNSIDGVVPTGYDAELCNLLCNELRTDYCKKMG